MRSQKISFNGLTQPFEQTYAYDDLNRLQSSTETVNSGATTTWKQTFQYDRFGNRRFDAANTTNLSQSSPTKVTNPLINTSDNRLKKDQDGDAVNDYDYDKTGNLIQDSDGKTFLYDAENHQKEVLINGVSKGKYHYDGEGKRVKKISDLETTIFVYNGGGQLVAEYSTQQSSTPQVSYLTQDHLGSPRIITDNVGKVIARKDFNAFGDETSSAQRTELLGYKPEEVRRDYTGYQKDDESGLEFAQARYYNNKHGRFTSVDPLVASANVKDPQTFNRYRYGLNSPYKFTDPLGLVANDAGGGSSRGGDVGHGHLTNSKGMSLDFPIKKANNVEVSATVNSPATANHETNHAPATPTAEQNADLTDAEIRAQYPVFNAADQIVVNQAITDARSAVDPSGGTNITPSALIGAFRRTGDTTTPQQAMANVDATTGTAVKRNAEGQITTPIKQNVFDGRTSTFMVDADGDPATAEITVAEFSRQNPTVNAITVAGNIFVYQGFFNQTAEGRAKSVIHEAVVHIGFNRYDNPDFGATRTDGSNAINSSIDRAYRLYRARPIQPIE
jgi:RHS repeat-associated protein